MKKTLLMAIIILIIPVVSGCQETHDMAPGDETNPIEIGVIT